MGWELGTEPISLSAKLLSVRSFGLFLSCVPRLGDSEDQRHLIA